MKFRTIALIFAAAAASPARADGVLWGNTIVEQRLGIGIATNSVPSQTLEINGHVLLRRGWPGIYLQEPATVGDDAFGIRYINSTANGTLQCYFDPSFPSGDNRAFLSVGEDLGVTIGRGDYSRGFNLHVRRSSDRNGGLLLSAESGVNPTLAFMGNDFLTRGWIGMEEAGGTHAITFTTLPQAGVTLTAMSIVPNGNIALGAHVPAEKLDVAGNIKASGTISAADPAAPTHVVTKQWLEASLSHLEPQGDISMGEFTAEP